MKAKGILDYDKFRIAALNETGVSFCTRTHFGKRLPGETEYYARFAYSGIGLDKIEEGLIKFKRFIER
jgi:aspartate/methionine/tyrosine aminotransferase